MFFHTLSPPCCLCHLNTQLISALLSTFDTLEFCAYWAWLYAKSNTPSLGSNLGGRSQKSMCNSFVWLTWMYARVSRWAISTDPARTLNSIPQDGHRWIVLAEGKLFFLAVRLWSRAAKTANALLQIKPHISCDSRRLHRVRAHKQTWSGFIVSRKFLNQSRQGVQMDRMSPLQNFHVFSFDWMSENVKINKGAAH